MINVGIAILVIFAALKPTPAAAADELELLSLDDEILTEPRVTAEAVFVGLVWPRLNEAEAVSGLILAAIPPAMRGEEICVRVTTEDGRYTGIARYRDKGVATSAMTILPYAPAKAGLGDYSDDSVAVLAFPCSEAARLTDLAVTSWRSNEAGLRGESVNLLINSFRADEAFLVVDNAKEIDCVALDAGERAAFDFSCPLAVSDIRQGARVALFRVRGASMDPEVAINIFGWE